jgi:hypothetical protein
MRGHPERYFYFALAEKLGMTVSEMLRKISSSELTEWMAFFKVRAAFEKQQMENPELADEVKAGYDG